MFHQPNSAGRTGNWVSWQWQGGVILQQHHQFLASGKLSTKINIQDNLSRLLWHEVAIILLLENLIFPACTPCHVGFLDGAGLQVRK